MQWAISPDVLVLLGAGAVALIIALFVVLSRRRRKRPADDAPAAAVAEPTAADWTGEAASGPSDPPRARQAAAAPLTTAQPATVADAVAAREAGGAREAHLARTAGEADTAPLPIRFGRHTRQSTAEGAPDGDAGADTPAAPTAAEPAAPTEQSAPSVAAEVPAGHPAPADEPGAVEEPPAVEPAEPEPANWAAPPVVRPLSAGSSQTVAEAVAQALAARAAAAERAEAAAALPGDRAKPVPPRVDARDRLLAVLLDDPVRAVSAAADLDRCRDQLERLTDAVRHERGVLAGVLHRLAEAGLQIEQIARLADLPVDEVRALLGPSTRRN
ncbi:hypothetical protein [Pseudonocardia acidicola]|uniref:Uncharacterized protein n=1 Tax=Pseudonocardia acidicola TaxID=2724939 RepID=A0ABX1SCW8_9PSEU|nr:hypothetical protein [Pseudonocardia acidicola]NMH98647.1 hypothetical protein [Pseudonocardia acidicola]